MFETPRLLIRKFRDEDAEHVFAMRSDPEIMRYIREPQFHIQETLNWMAMITGHLESKGIGFMAVIEKESGAFVGWCGLWILKETREVEIGYAVRKERWGRGYATEAAERVLRYAFEELGLERVVAVAFPDNSASIKIMKKLGMEHVGLGRFYEQDLVQYALKKEEFEQMIEG